jgi:hypothetical protein
MLYLIHAAPQVSSMVERNVFKNPPVWEQIQHSIKYVTYVNQNIMKIINEDERFDELKNFKNISKNNDDEWNMHLIKTV